MNNYLFIKKLNDKLNNLRSNKKIINLIKNIEENKAITIIRKNKTIKSIKGNKIVNNIIKKRKYLITASIIILSGGLIYSNYLNKNNSIVEKNAISNANIEPKTIKSEENNNEQINISQTKENKNDKLNISQTKENNNEQNNITRTEKNNKYELIIEEQSANDLLSPLISPSELDSEIPKGRMDPFNKTNNLSLGDTDNVYLDLKVYGVISVEDKIYALTKSELGSALICSRGRGKCDKFSSDILPKGWELIDIDINTGCAKLINNKSIEKSICMSSL
tara:strand:- start:27 stop:860 length:834 start_codon:yes stop_codon:yes gene_type:complete